jgi:hypothetical protein
MSNPFRLLEIPSSYPDYSHLNSSTYWGVGDTKDERCCFCFPITKTGIIKKVGLFVYSLKGTPKIKFRFEELYDGSSGAGDRGAPISDPASPELDGKPFGSSDWQSVQIDTEGYLEITFDTPADVRDDDLGKIVAFVCKGDTVIEGEYVRFGKVDQRDYMNLPYGAYFSGYGTGFMHKADIPDVALIYFQDDVDVCEVIEPMPITAVEDLEVYANSVGNTKINKAGNRFTFPYTVCLGGVWMFLDTFNADWILNIEDGEGNVLLSPPLQFYNAQHGRTAMSWQSGHRIILPSEVTLVKDTEYRIYVAVNYQAETNKYVTLREITVNDNLLFNCFRGGLEMYKTSKKGSASWVEDSVKRILLGLLVTGIGGKEKSCVF